MFHKIAFIFAFLFAFTSYSQYRFEGQLAESINSKTVYLSVIEDYRKLSRISLDQIIKKTSTDSLGYFKFEGDNLLKDNRIYRIHIDECQEDTANSRHFFERCENSRSVLFIANNNDKISFPTTFANEFLCKINSTNINSSIFLEIDNLKNEMAFDFNEFRSTANKKLNSKKWFSRLQNFGETLNEPLAELYIFDFLSDKRNETYSYYLKDIANNTYYSELAERIENKYPNTIFTILYKEEIITDKNIATQKNSGNSYWKIVLGLFLAFSVLLNIFLLVRRRINRKQQHTNAYKKLTSQEQNVIDEILNNKTNKEIAASLFVSVSTVKTHINNLYKKLNVSSRNEIKQLFG